MNANFVHLQREKGFSILFMVSGFALCSRGKEGRLEKEKEHRNVLHWPLNASNFVLFGKP